MIGDPLAEPGVKLTIVTCRAPPTDPILAGAFGTVKGVIEVDADEEVELPATLLATTVKVYGVPLVNPV